MFTIACNPSWTIVGLFEGTIQLTNFTIRKRKRLCVNIEHYILHKDWFVTQMMSQRCVEAEYSSPSAGIPCQRATNRCSTPAGRPADVRLDPPWCHCVTLTAVCPSTQEHTHTQLIRPDFDAAACPAFIAQLPFMLLISLLASHCSC